jgi:hypothetical protein
MVASAGYQLVAQKIAEAAMQHGDVKARLKDVINDHKNAKGSKHEDDEYLDHDGDGSEGNCTYICKGDIRQAPYEVGTTGGKAAASIDFDNSKNVVPVTNYVPEADDADNYTSTTEAAGIYLQCPLYERFISKKTRDTADSGSFAGKGKSFPILKAEDVSAALHSIGRAGPGNYSGDTIRANIKRIAKAKGFALPDSLKDAGKESFRKPLSSEDISRLNALREAGILPADQVQALLSAGSVSSSTSGRRPVSRDTQESLSGDPSLKSTWKPEGVLLLESGATFCEQPRLTEAASQTYPIKLMSPGRGSSGYYPPETLKKASESNVFKAGTQMFWNHDTEAEEAARPEGDLTRLAAVTTTDAKYMENGHDGPGLYAHAKVFADYADKVKEMGPHIGLSIRAGGDRDESAKGPDGKPRVITALRNAASVDFVTKAGRDGKIFTESATREGEDMNKDEVQALIRESLAPVQAENKALKEMLAATRAPALINKHLDGIRLPEEAKKKIREGLALSIPTDAAGNVDDAKLKTLVEASAADWATTLQSLGVGANPASLGKRITEAELLPIAEALDKQRDEVYEGLADIFVGPKISKGDGDEFKRQMRKNARKSFAEGRAA